MERLLYNCEELRLTYDEGGNSNDIEIVYTEDKDPTDDNTYFILKNITRAPGSLLHVFINNKDKGLFIIDTNGHLVSITYGEQFYKPLYKAYDDLISDIGKIGTMEE